MRVSGLYIELRFLLSICYIRLYNHKNISIYSIQKKCSTLTSAAFKGLNFIDYDTVKIL